MPFLALLEQRELEEPQIYVCLIAPRKGCHSILGCISKLNWKSGIYSRPFDQGALQVQKSKNTDRWGLELSIRRIISSFNFSSADT